ncbi:MAG: RNA methyltransferase [Clostridia bacterium]|nr:RNA methyltransferase [Clostridia bacterium]
MQVLNLEKITSRSNNKIVEASKLVDRKYRESSKCFFIEGIKLFREAMQSGAEFVRVFVTEDAILKYSDDISKANCKEKYEVSSEVFSKITNENAPQGIFAVLKYYSPSKKDGNEKNISIVLDEISDPGNLGTIIRCADAMGIDCVYIGDNGVDLFNPKTVRSCMGSLFRVNTVRCNVITAIENLRQDGYKVYAAVLNENAVDVRKIDHNGKIAFVVGNEGRGVSSSTVPACNGSIIIPMMENVNSLNAAVAASVLMWEVSRDRL